MDIDGEGYLKDNLVNYIQSNNLYNIKFKGWTNEPNRVLSRSGAALITSKYEGYSLLCKNAIVNQCALLSYDIK